MFDMRYHIASLVAVFLALTVGLLLGSLIADKGVIANQQEKLVESIRSDIRDMGEENVALRAKLQQLDDFQSQVLPIAVKNRLTGKKAAVVALTPDQGGLVAEISRVLEAAGAVAVPVRIDILKIDFSDNNLVARLSSKFDAGGAQGGDFERRFWSRLAAELAGREPPALTNELIAMNLVQVDPANLPLDSAVVLAPGDKKIGNRDALVLEALVQTGQVYVIGAETVNAKPSRIAVYKLRNVSTVDNIETIPGKIALVYLLENREPTAHYGAKSTADKLLP